MGETEGGGGGARRIGSSQSGAQAWVVRRSLPRYRPPPRPLSVGPLAARAGSPGPSGTALLS